jgi:hypothetical protein
MAGFEVTTNGRFWVTAEGCGPRVHFRRARMAFYLTDLHVKFDFDEAKEVLEVFFVVKKNTIEIEPAPLPRRVAAPPDRCALRGLPVKLRNLHHQSAAWRQC